MSTRRRFILGTLVASGALVLGWSLVPPRQRLKFSGPAAPIDAIYNNAVAVVDGLPFHPEDDGVARQLATWFTNKAMREVGAMVTGGSSSVRDLWGPMREAGASARAMFVGAAAKAWGVPAGEISVRAGRLAHASGRQAGFGELAAAAAQQPVPGQVMLKMAAQFALIGQPIHRLEAAGKVDGTARFGLDVRQPGMRYASVRMCPTLGGRVASFDAKAAEALPGVLKVLAVDGHHGGTAGVAVIATSPWRALQALQALQVVWDENVPAAGFSSNEALERLSQLLKDEPDAGFGYLRRGDVPAALASARKTLTAEYRAPWLAHSTLEPQNCTVRVEPERATVWAPTQVPGLARRAVAKLLGLDEESVELNVTLLGGGFGRRLEVDFIAQAAAIARALPGVPVQTFWSRSEDLQHDFYRPGAVAHFKAGLDAQCRLTAWHNLSAGQAILPQVTQRLLGLPGLPLDKSTSEGAYDQPYEWPNARVAHRIVDLPVPVGFWRSVGHSHQAFFKEAFMDEVAHAAGQDPVAFRIGLLQKHPRQRAVLERAAAMAKWGTPAEPAADGAPVARGVALHSSFGATVAQVAEVSLGPDKTIRVHRVFCAIDCGTAINPNLIRQQMDSGIVFGLTAALYGQIDIVQGRVTATNFHQQRLLTIDECPVIDTEILASTEPPEGVGEPGTPPIAPAVANALFALTGQRLRSLPLKVN